MFILLFLRLCLSASISLFCFVLHFVASEKEAKELVLSSGAIDFLHSTSNASSVVVPILNKLQLSQEALTNPLPETTRIVRSLVRIAKRENRYDVVKHLKEMTPAGTAGSFLSLF